MPDDSTARFSSRADVYDSARPSYPASAIDEVLRGLGSSPRMADIGAGTGIASRLLAARGCHVIAIEPNEAMRASGEARHDPKIEWQHGTGESTGLAEASVDGVVCAQAFHWLDGPAAIREFMRILRPGGRMSLMWNVHDASDPAMAAYRTLMLQHATDPPTSPWNRDMNDLLASASALELAITRHANTQRVDYDGLVNRALSSSYVPREGDAHESLMRGLRALYDTYADDDGLILRYETSVYCAERSCL